MNYKVVCLAEHQEFIEKCANLLNEQWPRSKAARLRSLEPTSLTSFPTSLVLIQESGNNNNNDEIKVIGHSKVLPVPHSDEACFVESVVIAHSLRGKGLGKLIMDETEKFVKTKGITRVHLTTHDKQGFYQKLGYSLSEPIVVYGGISTDLQKLIQHHTIDIDNQHRKKDDEDNNVITTTTIKSTENQMSTSKAPPPPPPPPMPSSINNQVEVVQSKAYMVKYLT